MQIWVINGAAGSGKDTFVKFCQEIAGESFVLNVSTVDKVKEIATLCGWDGTKTPENRKFLSDLKSLLTQWADVPVNDVIEKINTFKRKFDLYDVSNNNALVFIHCREPEEIVKLVKKLRARTIVVRRSSAEREAASNLSDANVLNYKYDTIVVNDGTLDDLKHQAEYFVHCCR